MTTPSFRADFIEIVRHAHERLDAANHLLTVSESNADKKQKLAQSTGKAHKRLDAAARILLAAIDEELQGTDELLIDETQVKNRKPATVEQAKKKESDGEGLPKPVSVAPAQVKPPTGNAQASFERRPELRPENNDKVYTIDDLILDDDIGEGDGKTGTGPKFSSSLSMQKEYKDTTFSDISKKTTKF